ncbi:Holliday junction branch migration protein RuvA [Fidelibacter multiformis]|jgi:Holliday junction DNA helicase RuvA|uniref:Holliday junction branch migration protein RuvA n=1 Tax=Fidelibacter multiformis TaxID=3377529 RepID=UPI0037DD9DF5
MISSLRGILTEKHPDTAVIQAGPVGIEVFITLNTYESLPETGESCQLYTYLHVREDILSLYGFADPEEKNLFLKLISLNGIGPRNAQSMLSGIKADEFRRCILSGDIKSLTKIPGVGEKKARRIIIELKEKLSEEELAEMTGSAPAGPMDRRVEEALAGLETLGFRKTDVLKAVERFALENPEAETDTIIRHILRNKK